MDSDEQSNNVINVQEQKMNIFLKVIKTVCFSVKKSDTVRNVKAILAEKEGMSECVTQNLFFSGECLRENRKLVDCGIQENSMLQVFVQDSLPLTLFVKPQSQDKVIVIEANTCETVEKVKSSIMVKEGIHDSGSFNLIYAGKQLAEDRTLESLHIQGDSTLHMVNTPKLAFTLKVKMPSGEILRVEVKQWYTLRDVKTLVESVFSSTVDHLSFAYNGVRLDDSKSLPLYDITENSMLEMLPKSIQVSVKTQVGKVLTHVMSSEDFVMTLRKKIADEEAYYPNSIRLVLDGMLLNVQRTLASYGIENGDTLDLILQYP